MEMSKQRQLWMKTCETHMEHERMGPPSECQPVLRRDPPPKIWKKQKKVDFEIYIFCFLDMSSFKLVAIIYWKHILGAESHHDITPWHHYGRHKNTTRPQDDLETRNLHNEVPGSISKAIDEYPTGSDPRGRSHAMTSLWAPRTPPLGLKMN